MNTVKLWKCRRGRTEDILRWDERRTSLLTAAGATLTGISAINEPSLTHSSFLKNDFDSSDF